MGLFNKIEDNDVGGEDMTEETPQVQVDENADLLEAPVAVEKSVQVEDAFVIYMPRKDFTARVNQDEFNFRTGVPTRVTRDVANMLLEDEDRGYVKD